MSIIDFFKPDPPKIPIEDKEGIKREYRYWRWRVFYSIYIGYAIFYFTRKSLVSAMPGLISNLGFEEGQLGILLSLISISYGVSKFFSGVISDKTNLRYFMGFGLIMTGVANLLFGLSSTLLFFSFFCMINGFFQGWGSPPCARLLTYWYSHSERGRWWGVWNTSHNIGGALIPPICAFVMGLLGWRYAMYVPGILAIFSGFFLINRIRDNPQSRGLPSVETYRNDFSALDEVSSENGKSEGLTSREILTKYVLKNRSIWILALSVFFVYVIRTAVNDWVQLYLIKEKGFSIVASASCVSSFEIGGIFGGLGAGWLSDTLFKGRRGPVNVLFSLGITLVLLVLWANSSSSVLFFSTMMFTVGFLIFGPQMLIGVAAAEMAGKRASGSATGFTGLFAYIGATVAGYPFAKMKERFGWSGFFILLGTCSVIAVAMLLPLWNKKSNIEVETA